MTKPLYIQWVARPKARRWNNELSLRTMQFFLPALPFASIVARKDAAPFAHRGLLKRPPIFVLEVTNFVSAVPCIFGIGFT